MEHLKNIRQKKPWLDNTRVPTNFDRMCSVIEFKFSRCSAVKQFSFFPADPSNKPEDVKQTSYKQDI